MSIWGEPFEDELHDDLRHNARGVLSMANSGPNSNKEFFQVFENSPKIQVNLDFFLENGDR